MKVMTKKRFYIDQERVNKEMHHSFVYLRDQTQSPPEEPLWIDTADRTDTDELRYLKELCDLLNKGWEATEGETTTCCCGFCVRESQERTEEKSHLEDPDADS